MDQILTFLGNIDVVGITEHYDEFISLFLNRMGWPISDGQYSKKLVFPQSFKSVDADVLCAQPQTPQRTCNSEFRTSIIQSYLLPDYKIYDHASQVRSHTCES